MRKYIVQWNAGMCGTDEADCCMAEDGDAAVEMFVDTAWEHYYSFKEMDEDEGFDDELDIWAEEYDPEKHDGLCVNGPWKF